MAEMHSLRLLPLSFVAADFSILSYTPDRHGSRGDHDLESARSFLAGRYARPKTNCILISDRV